MFSVFIEKCIKFTSLNGFTSLITQQSWMFLERFSELRKSIISKQLILNMLHLGTKTFDDIGGEVVQSTSFVLRKMIIDEYSGIYVRLTEYNNKEKPLEFNNIKNKYLAKQNNFNIIPNNYIAYWVSEKLKDTFDNYNNLNYFGDAREGMATANNDYFLKYWYEISKYKISFNSLTREESIKSKKKFFPYNKGGEYRKWYGNREYVVNWYNDGEEIRNFKNENGKVKSHNYNLEYIFNEGIGWSSISSNNFNCRYIPCGTLSDSKGPTYYCNDNNQLYYILGFLNSVISNEILKILAPTLDYKVGDIADIPIIFDDIKHSIIDSFVLKNINLCKKDWDSFETSWNFKNILSFATEHLYTVELEILMEKIIHYLKWKKKNLTMEQNGMKKVLQLIID